MHRDTNCDEPIGNDNRGGDNFSAGQHDFWKDTYQEIAGLGHHGRGHGHGGHHCDHLRQGSENKHNNEGGCGEQLDFGCAASVYGDASLGKVSYGKTDSPSEAELRSQQVVELLHQILQLEQQLMQYLQRLNGGGSQSDSGSVDSNHVSEPAQEVDSNSGHATEPVREVDSNTGHADAGDTVTETPTAAAPGTYSLEDAIAQNDMSKRAQVIADIPYHGPNSWADGKAIVDNNVIPPGIEDFAPWSVVSQEQGKVADRDTQITVGNQHVYYHKKGGGWVEAANPDNTGFWEGRYYNDFRGNASFDDPSQKVVDGMFQFTSAPEGQVNHLGNGNTPVRFDPNLYDGVFERLDAKADRNNSNLVIDLAGDYYRPTGKIWGEEGQNDSNLRNPGAGTSNWTRLTDQVQTLYYKTMDADVLRNEPPPGMS